MKTNQNIHSLIFLLATATLLLLSGCGGIAFSPEAAIRQEISGQAASHLQVDPTTIEVLQTVQAVDRHFVMASFNGVNRQGEQEWCLYTYEALQRTGLWLTGGGGGGCSNANPDLQQDPMTIGGGRSGGGNRAGDVGYSHVNGYVRDENVKSVLVTWGDGTTQEVDVVKKSYIAVRAGQLNFLKLEAMDGEKGVVFTYESNPPAPGKEE